MSKRVKIFLMCCMTIMLFCGFVGCQNMNRALEESVSEIHETVLNGQDDNFFVEVIGGKIESDYALDGVKNNAHDFIAVKVQVKGAVPESIIAEFTVKNNRIEKELTRSPLNNRIWTATIEGNLPVETLALTLTIGEEKFEYELQKVSADGVKPLDILKENFEEKLMECYENGKFNCEVSVRLVKSPKEDDNRYFWYVVVYKPDKSFFGLMIDSATGEIVAKKG